MTMHSFGEISDDILTKYHLPMGMNIWKMIKDLGWERVSEGFSGKGIEKYL